MFKKHFSYANVIASLALFLALGGTAVAAATLTRDSVGSPQIRQDAVRSPEIAKDAVRSSEIKDESVKSADLTNKAASELLGEVRVAERTVPSVARDCGGDDVTACPDILTLDLSSVTSLRAAPAPTPGPQVREPGRNWLVQAKLVTNGAETTFIIDHCGLVNTRASGPNALLDESKYVDGVNAMALSGVVRKNAENPTIALRCTSQPENQLITENVKITALEVGAVTGP